MVPVPEHISDACSIYDGHLSVVGIIEVENYSFGDLRLAIQIAE
jgi:hypothetical protein